MLILNEVLKYANELGDVHHQLIAFLNLAEGYAQVNNQQQRIYYLTQALEIGRENDVIFIKACQRGLKRKVIIRRL